MTGAGAGGKRHCEGKVGLNLEELSVWDLVMAPGELRIAVGDGGELLEVSRKNSSLEVSVISQPGGLGLPKIA